MSIIPPAQIMNSNISHASMINTSNKKGVDVATPEPFTADQE